MRAKVTGDMIRREIWIELDGAPNLDVTRLWQTKPRIIRPRLAKVLVHDGETRDIRIKGWLIKKNGEPSISVTDYASWAARSDSSHGRITEAPEWVQLIWREAPAGVIVWDLNEARANQ